MPLNLFAWKYEVLKQKSEREVKQYFPWVVHITQFQQAIRLQCSPLILSGGMLPSIFAQVQYQVQVWGSYTSLEINTSRNNVYLNMLCYCNSFSYFPFSHVFLLFLINWRSECSSRLTMAQGGHSSFHRIEDGSPGSCWSNVEVFFRHWNPYAKFLMVNNYLYEFRKFYFLT